MTIDELLNELKTLKDVQVDVETPESAIRLSATNPGVDYSCPICAVANARAGYREFGNSDVAKASLHLGLSIDNRFKVVSASDLTFDDDDVDMKSLRRRILTALKVH